MDKQRAEDTENIYSSENLSSQWMHVDFSATFAGLS